MERGFGAEVTTRPDRIKLIEDLIEHPAGLIPKMPASESAPGVSATMSASRVWQLSASRVSINHERLSTRQQRLDDPAGEMPDDEETQAIKILKK